MSGRAVAKIFLERFFVDKLFADDGVVGGRFDADAYDVARNAHDRDDDLVADHDAFADFSSYHEHGGVDYQ